MQNHALRLRKFTLDDTEDHKTAVELCLTLHCKTKPKLRQNHFCVISTYAMQSAKNATVSHENDLYYKRTASYQCKTNKFFSIFCNLSSESPPGRRTAGGVGRGPGGFFGSWYRTIQWFFKHGRMWFFSQYSKLKGNESRELFCRQSEGEYPNKQAIMSVSAKAKGKKKKKKHADGL